MYGLEVTWFGRTRSVLPLRSHAKRGNEREKRGNERELSAPLLGIDLLFCSCHKISLCLRVVA